MSTTARARLSNLLSHFLPASASPNTPADAPPTYEHTHHLHSLSPTAFLPRAAAIEPDAPAVHHTSADGQAVRRTYAQLADRACGFAYYLRARGLRRVGILCPNTPAFLEAIYGIAAAGAVNVAINYRLKPDDLAYIFAHADVDAILVDAEFLPLLAGFAAAHPHVALIVDADAGADTGGYADAVRAGRAHDAAHGARGWAGLAAQADDEEALLALAYTSGTTARPKGVEYTHRGAYLAALGNVVEAGLAYHEGRCRYLWTLPMFHAMGWTFPWAVTAVRGTHYCLRRIDYAAIWTLLSHEGITHFCAAPTVNTLLCAHPSAARLSSPVRVTVAASPPTAHLFAQMAALNLRALHVYGLTETYGPITRGYVMPAWDGLPDAERYARMARQGHGFLTSLPVRVVRTGDAVPPGVIEDVARDGSEVGEIVFSGNICARGYYKDAAATRALYAGGVQHSGDLAVVHADGAVQIIDRGKDVIISGGENISSLAVEAVLVTHPDVLEAAIVAVKDERWGERPLAYVTVKQGGSEGVTGESILGWAKAHRGMSGFMVPREVEVVEELPKTSTGKVRKNVLREWAKGAERSTAE